MEVPGAAALLDRIRALEAGPPLLERLAEQPGVYLVGGAVRDLLGDREPPDIDLVVEGDPLPVVAQIGGEIRTYDRFGTATVTLGPHTYDIARARREHYPAPGALPEVEPAPLVEDLRRRDFTVNAAAIELGGPDAGGLHAVPSALEDLDAGVLRVLHDRSFIDDPTRLFRLARYAARLRFDVDPHTRELADAAVAGGAIATVTGPRIGAELRLLAAEPDPVAAFASVQDLGLGAELRLRPLDAGVAGRAFALLPPDGERSTVVLALVAEPDGLAERLTSLGFEAARRDAIVAAATGSEALAAALGAAVKPSEIAAAVAEARPEQVAVAGALGDGEQARTWLATLRHVQLQIDGSDLIEAGISEGPAIGRGLRAALAAKLDGRVDGRAAELSEAVRAAR